MKKLITIIALLISIGYSQAGYITCEITSQGVKDGYYSYDISSKQDIKEYNQFKQKYNVKGKRYFEKTNTSKQSKYC